VIATAVIGKWGGAMVAARLTGESWHDATMIGVLMNTRGLTEIVIATVGLELGVITATVYTMLVLMALATTFMAAPILAVIDPSTRRHASESKRGPPPPAHHNGARGASPRTPSTTPNHGDQCASS
jgi:Kef-type K+ transport system membrane component KefB